MKRNKTEEIALEGVLVAAAWGASGEVTEVALTTFDETEYRIDSETTRNHGLTDLLRRHVQLTAVIRGDRVIQVRRIEVLGLDDGNAGQPPQQHVSSIKRRFRRAPRSPR